MGSRQQCSAEAELCEVFLSARPGAQHWLLHYSAVVVSFKAAEVTPMAQAMKRCCGDGSGLCWLLSITDLGLGTLSWAVPKCVGDITAVCLSLCCGLHLPLYPCEADLMEGLGQSLWPCCKSSLVCMPKAFPHPCKTKLNGATQRMERKGGSKAVRWAFSVPLMESMKLHISKTRHGTPSPLFKPCLLLSALALVVFLSQAHAVPSWIGKYLIEKIQTKMLCNARVWERLLKRPSWQC